MKEMDIMQKEFDKKQKALIAAGVVPADAILITSENKIQRVVEQCRRSHGGPITEESEVENIVAKYKDDKSKKSALVLEIRYRKFTVLNKKESNLFSNSKPGCGAAQHPSKAAGVVVK